jgi:hypothetical protein
VRLTAIIVTAFALAGCASVAEQSADLAGQRSCCTAMSEFKFVPLPAKGVDVPLFPAYAPVYEFDGRKSYFAPFIVSGSNVRSIDIESDLSGYRDLQFLAPAFLFLDRKHEPLALATPALRYEPPGIIRFGHMEGKVLVPEDAAFMVVLSAPASEAVSVDHPGTSTIFMMQGNIPIVVPHRGKTAVYEPAPTGKLVLTPIARESGSPVR